MFTAPFNRYVRPARRHPQLWRLILGIFVIVVVYIISVLIVFFTMWSFSGSQNLEFWSTKVLEASTPTSAMLVMSSFIGMALAPMIAVKLIHKRRVGSLFGPQKLVVRHFLLATGIAFSVFSVITFGWFMIFDGVPNLDPALWLLFLPIALLGVFVQTGAEELIFRGYLMQQLAARFRSPLIWFALPCIIFGLFHYDPETACSNAWLIVMAASFFGLIAADLTRLTGSIGASWGFHFTNNVFALLLIAVDGTIPGLALYLTPYAADDASQIRTLIYADFSGLLLVWWALRRFLTR